MGTLLINKITKLFTEIIAHMIQLWTENENLTPEKQAGCRSLVALISISLEVRVVLMQHFWISLKRSTLSFFGKNYSTLVLSVKL